MENKPCIQSCDPEWPAGSLPLRTKPTGIEGGFATRTSFLDEFGNRVEIGGKEPLGATALQPAAELELCVGSRS